MHKKVFPMENVEVMKLKATRLHNKNHYGHNRLQSLCKTIYFTISREIIRYVCSKCNICSQTLPLKTKEKFKHIVAARPWDHVIMDLIDLKFYIEFNNEFAWVLTVIDVFSKLLTLSHLKQHHQVKYIIGLKNFFYKLHFRKFFILIMEKSSRTV